MALLDELRQERMLLATEREEISIRIEELLIAIRALEGTQSGGAAEALSWGSGDFISAPLTTGDKITFVRTKTI